MTFFYGPARCWARQPVAVKEMVNFSASCDVQHIADFSRICAMCDVHGGPIPAYISNKKLFVTVCASCNAGRDRPQKPLNLFLIFSKANLFPCSQKRGQRSKRPLSIPIVHFVVASRTEHNSAPLSVPPGKGTPGGPGGRGSLPVLILRQFR